jgi:tetratricopeptide (TPR) repeat protein
MIHPLPRSAHSRYRSWAIYCVLILSISSPLTQIQASQNVTYTAVVSPAKGSLQGQQLNPGEPIERKLAGGESHYYAYQLSLAAGQYVKLVVDQRGIDLVVRLFGPDGKQIREYDSEIRTLGEEAVSWVAEAAGSYRLDVAARYKDAAEGRYGIRVAELRVATEDDRVLYEAEKLNTESRGLIRAGKYDEARPLAERALAIRERVLGPEHPDVDASLNVLAAIHIRKSDYARSESLFQRALAISEKALGPEHPSVANYLDSLANVYSGGGDYTKSEPLYQRAIAIREKFLGPEHPHVAHSLNNLGILYNELGDLTKAEQCLQRALAIYEKRQGPEHPDLILPLNNLAKVYQNNKGLRGNYAKAEQLYQRALSIGEKVLGTEHPFVVSILTSLATLYDANNDYVRAEPLFQRALTISEKILGPENFAIVTCLRGLARISKKTGNYANAETLYQRALAVVEKALPPGHLEIGESLYDLGEFYAAKGDIAQALTFLSRASSIAEANYALNLAVGSERQKLAFLTPVVELTDLTLTLQSEAAPNDPQALNLAFKNLLLWKGRALDAMTDTISTLRRHATVED